MLCRPSVVLAAVAATLLIAAAGAGASTLVFECGQGVCAVDPDTPAPPVTLAAQGTAAGITRDGVTASWVDANGALVQAPAAGGAPHVVFDGTVGSQPSMSPDGSRYLWWHLGPGPGGDASDAYINELVVGQSPTSVSNCSGCVTSHGWLGTAAIAAYPGETSAPSEICRVDATPGGNCIEQLATDARGGIGFPTGSPDGSRIAAVLSVGSRLGTEGRIVTYPVPAGGPVQDVTTGTGDSLPAWSADGTRLAFERGGQIVVHDLASGAERVVAAGADPFWGGPATVPAPVPVPVPAPMPAPTPAVAPRATLTIPHSRRVAAWRTLRGRVTGAASSVDIDVRRRVGRRCVVYTGRRFAGARCSVAPRWVSARVRGGRWALVLHGARAGRYTIAIRARGARGQVGPTLTRRITLR